MMKNSKYFLLAALGLMAAPALAQETYQDTKLAENSLNGTARYVGMGGAMEALGAPPLLTSAANADTIMIMGRQTPTPVSASAPSSGICPI